MAETLASLQGELDALRAAYRTGATEISYDGKRISYRDGSEMRAAMASIENAINGYTGASKPRSIVVRSNKGWG